MIDGGYNENYGVAAALDWLTPVLDAHCAGDQDLTFKRVAIVQLRAFPTEKLRSKKPKSGAISALIGPLVGLLQIRTGVAMERNRIDVTRFIETQTNRFCQAAEPSSNDDPRIELKTFVFQPLSESDAPLSWHLTTEQKKALRDSWESQENKDTLKDLIDYLSSAKTEEAPETEQPRLSPDPMRSEM